MKNIVFVFVLFSISEAVFAGNFDGRRISKSEITSLQIGKIVAESAFYYNLDGRGFPGNGKVALSDGTNGVVEEPAQIQVIGNGIRLQKMDPQAERGSEHQIDLAKVLRIRNQAVCQANISIRTNSEIQNLASVLVGQCLHLNDGSKAPEFQFEMTSWSGFIDVTLTFDLDSRFNCHDAANPNVDKCYDRFEVLSPNECTGAQVRCVTKTASP